MKNIIFNGKDVDLNNCSISELNRLLQQTNSDQQDIKKEIDYVLDKLKEEL